MQYAFLGLALVAAVTAQGVVEPLFPDGVDGPPENSNYPKNAFVLSTIRLTDPEKPGYQPEAVDNNAYDCTGVSPKIALVGSALIDERGSTGSIVANDQFQFDGPPQAGVKVSAGWSRNDNGTLSLGTTDSSAIFYNCLSGDFNNIYSASQGEQCYPVYLSLQLCTGASSDGVNYDPVVKENTGVFEIPEGGAEDYLPDGGAGSSSATASSSSSSATESATMSSEAATTAVASATVMSEIYSGPSMTPVAVPAPVVPAVNASNPIATGTAITPPATTGASDATPSPFVNGGAAVVVGQKALAIMGVVAGAFAFA